MYSQVISQVCIRGVYSQVSLRQCSGGGAHQEQQRVVDDELSGECDHVLAHDLEHGGRQYHGQVVGRHLVVLREHLDPGQSGRS